MTKRTLVALLIAVLLAFGAGAISPTADLSQLSTVHADDCGRNNDVGNPDDECEDERPADGQTEHVCGFWCSFARWLCSNGFCVWTHEW